MKATRFEFRFRYVLHGIIFALGLSAPWNYLVPLDPRGPNAHVWGILAANLAQVGVGSLLTAFNILLTIAILFAFAGATLRTWGSAYLGASIVSSSSMHLAAANDGILRDGPFGYLRNPLYLGTFLHTLAVSLLMPRSGAIFSILAIGLFQVRLILGEEAFLTGKLGATYTAYCSLVPRIVPALRRKVQAAGISPRWAQAFLGEVYFWGVAISFAVFGWEYNAAKLIQCVIIAFGVSVVAGALMPGARQEAGRGK